MIYQGASTELILQPGSTVSIDPNGLITIVKTYACASTFNPSNSNDPLTLSVGEQGDNGTTLFTKTETVSNGIKTITCTYHGASGSSRVSNSTQVKSFDYLGMIGNTLTRVSGSYYAPTYTIEKAVLVNQDTISTPTLNDINGGYVKFSKVFGGDYNINSASDLQSLLNFQVDPVSVSRTNYGSVDVLVKVFSITSIYG
jgi:hypothetical protein